MLRDRIRSVADGMQLVIKPTRLGGLELKTRGSLNATESGLVNEPDISAIGASCNIIT